MSEVVKVSDTLCQPIPADGRLLTDEEADSLHDIAEALLYEAFTVYKERAKATISGIVSASDIFTVWAATVTIHADRAAKIVRLLDTLDSGKRA